MRLFVYGTLCDPACRARVSGRALSGRPARLAGWQRLEPPGEYPRVERAAGAVVDGLLLDDVDDTALRRLDDYEGPLYRRLDVTVLVDGEDVVCQVYAGRGRPVPRS